MLVRAALAAALAVTLAACGSHTDPPETARTLALQAEPFCEYSVCLVTAITAVGGSRWQVLMTDQNRSVHCREVDVDRKLATPCSP